MFNPKQFENKLYAFVTKEVNQAFSGTLINSHDSLFQTKTLKIQREIIETLHFVTEEIVFQISCGLLINAGSR